MHMCRTITIYLTILSMSSKTFGMKWLHSALDVGSSLFFYHTFNEPRRRLGLLFFADFFGTMRLLRYSIHLRYTQTPVVRLLTYLLFQFLRTVVRRMWLRPRRHRFTYMFAVHLNW